MSRKTKNKKLLKIYNTKIDMSISEEKDNYIFTLVMNSILEPAIRPKHRMNDDGKGARTYDALASYKRIIKKELIEFCNNSELDIFPYEGSIISSLTIIKKPPKSWSKIRRYDSIKENLPILSKPDLDNYDKTIWDCLNEIVIHDDSFIWKENGEKYYGIEDKTKLVLLLEKPRKILRKGNRLSKEENLYIDKLYSEEV